MVVVVEWSFGVPCELLLACKPGIGGQSMRRRNGSAGGEELDSTRLDSTRPDSTRLDSIARGKLSLSLSLSLFEV